MQAPVIVWFRRNLRLIDNAALLAACRSEKPVVCAFVLDELETGGASRWWLHHSLDALEEALRSAGNRLILRRGKPGRELARIARECGADTICCSRRYEPAAIAQEAAVAAAVEADVQLAVFEDALLAPPLTVLTKTGQPYKVFTPYWRASTALGDPSVPEPAPARIAAPAEFPDSLALDALDLHPKAPDWSHGLAESWQPGETGALARLDMAADAAKNYATDRDRPDRDGTSRLSPHLSFGEVSPRQVWHAVRNEAGQGDSPGASALLRQLYWRDFSSYLLFHFPQLPDTPLRSEFEHFPWTNDPDFLEAWQKGRTGYPLVDAGMRQLWHTGWMHNRVRMVVASFLVKNLMVDWQSGAAWFLDTLVDADLGNNSAGWQWVAGCGTDAAPYFRIFNPVRQSEKFDPEGRYIRRWLPELSGLPDNDIHEPWKADGMTLELAGVKLDRDYPYPIVDHRETRERALAAYQDMRSLLQSPAARPGSSAG